MDFYGLSKAAERKTSMDAYQTTQIVVQVAGIAGLLVTLYFHYQQLKLMGVQLEEVRQTTTAGHILTLLGLMEAEDIRMARVLVHTHLHKKHFTTWTEEERRAASKVCTAYTNAGTVLKSGLVPIGPIIESWGSSLRLAYEILEPFIRDMQQAEMVGSAYWADFDWVYQQTLAAEARKQTRNAAPRWRLGFGQLSRKSVEKNDAV
jgi:hypothetical protein